MTSQEDHLCHHQHITSKTSSGLDFHTEQSYLKNQRTIQLKKFRWKLSSSWLRCIFILAQTHQSGQEIRNKRIHCSLCRFFPTEISTKKVFLVLGKCSPLEREGGGLWHSRWKVITDNGAISLQANLTPANQCQPRARP